MYLVCNFSYMNIVTQSRNFVKYNFVHSSVVVKMGTQFCLGWRLNG